LAVKYEIWTLLFYITPYVPRKWNEKEENSLDLRNTGDLMIAHK
jgi:hypothetical protein